MFVFSEVGGLLEEKPWAAERGGEEKALDERWEEELSYEEKGNQRRSGGGGRDTRTTLTIYGYAPMANGNYICFNYWCPNRLFRIISSGDWTAWQILLLLFTYDMEAYVDCVPLIIFGCE